VRIVLRIRGGKGRQSLQPVVKSRPTFLFSRPLSSYLYVGSVFYLLSVGLLEVLYLQCISYLGTLFA
jgi:hypothetical protein